MLEGCETKMNVVNSEKMSPLGKKTVATAVQNKTARMAGLIFSFMAEHNILFTKAMNFP